MKITEFCIWVIGVVVLFFILLSWMVSCNKQAAKEIENTRASRIQRKLELINVANCEYIVIEGGHDYNIIHKANCTNHGTFVSH